ncbi:hypothetical protein AALO_G00094900 [Alosa alosa]|uniref:Uncharacterized protein n=1 Tax=Alosa alosa TaxID=278164 RepID=A0AAV6GSH9_9TELE|nr:hypothetical protein AALO_G00094900 [Alosa alosa]
MGSKMAPSFASFYCGFFEQEYIWDQRNPHLQHITNWKRRIKRLCSREEDFQTQAQDLEARFNDRQCKPEWITGARRRFEDVPAGWPTSGRPPGA